MSVDSGKSESDRRREAAETRVGWQMAGIGMTVASEVAAGAIFGLIFDAWRGSGHTGVLVGSLCGISVGLFTLIRQTLRLNKQLDRFGISPHIIKPPAASPDDSDSDSDFDSDRDSDPLWEDFDDRSDENDDQPPTARPKGHA